MIETAILCLALNVYHESRNQPVIGQKAVAQVTMNRANNDPAKVCDAVFKPYQFSWANELTTVKPNVRMHRAHKFIPKENDAWVMSKVIARKAIIGTMRNPIGNADHYHTYRVAPRWASSMTVVATIGDHIFYER